VDSDGVIRSATTNLLLKSEEFNDASWTKNGVISSNQITAPDGVTSADLLTAAAATFSGNARQDITATVGQAYTSTIYVKKNNWRYVGIRFNTGVFGATERVPFYDFDTDTVSNGGVTAATISRTLLANGWVRLAVTFTATTTSGVHQIWITDSTGATQPLKVGTESVYIWGAQLEQSSTVGPYIPTTSTINSAPRFDHNPLTGECLGLLVEEQRTNLLLRSEEFDNASWAVARCSISANTSTSPAGTLTADTIVEDASNNTHRVIQSAITVTAGATVTYSIYFKFDGRSQISLYVDSGDGTIAFGAYFSASGFLASEVAGTGTFISSTFASLANGWYRASITGVVGTATSIRASVFSASGGSRIYQGDSRNALTIWGAQLEAGSGPPSSYIVTTGTAATRTADVVSVTGTNFSSWYRQDEGSMFVGFTPSSFAAIAGVASLNDGTDNNRVAIRTTGSALGNLRVANGGVSQADFVTVGALSAGTFTRMAGAYRLDSFALVTNNSAVATDTSGTVPTATRLTIGGEATGGIVNAPISRLTYWPTRLPNSTLQSITQ
jgi:hypothetical protein